MKKNPESNLNDELRPEYDNKLLKDGVRGKYSQRYHTGTNLVLLDPDVAAVFSDDQSVNQALRLLIHLAKTSVDR